MRKTNVGTLAHTKSKDNERLRNSYLREKTFMMLVCKCYVNAICFPYLLKLAYIWMNKYKTRCHGVGARSVML